MIKFEVEMKMKSKEILKKDVEILRALAPGSENEISAERVSPIIPRLVS
jgi:hypothetical protein